MVLLNSRNSEEQKEVADTVSSILREVRLKGDKAVIQYTKMFDGVEIKTLEVEKNILQQALKRSTRASVFYKKSNGEYPLLS